MKKIFLLIIFFCTSVCFALEEKTTVQVGISNSDFSCFEHNSIEFILKASSSISDMSSEVKRDVPANSRAIIKISNGEFSIDINGKNEIQNIKGPLVITSSAAIGIAGLKRKGDDAFYYGMIKLQAAGNDKFNVINVLDMQTYLKGVVPNEMPVSFGIEALKAQAVAARNYANRPVANYKNYDVCDSVACQVYYGANSQTAISDKAVDETLGIYALYNNEIILALYSSTSSGITEDYFNTFGDFKEDKPYLKSVSDTDKLSKMDDEEYFKTAPFSFDMESPKYRWQKEFDRFELESILSKTLVEQSKLKNVYPEFNPGDELYGLENIKVLKRGQSKKALEVEIKAVSKDYVIKKELPIRRSFGGLYSANFIVEKQKQKNSNDDEVIFENEHKIYRTRLGKKLPDKFIFYGAGFGHGVGMSQYGAGYLSNHGVSYDKILNHYYTNINLGTVPKTVSYNNLNIDYIQEFYFDKSKIKPANLSKNPLKNELKHILKQEKKQNCYLVIENPDNVSNVEFFINDFYFNPKISGFKKKILKTQIDDYLKQGKNKIVFKPLNVYDKKKSIKFYIVLRGENE